MQKLVAIDYLPESVFRYPPDWSIVAIDIIRATTTAVTAVSLGRRCFPVSNLESALSTARTLEEPLLAGESGGELAAGFEMNNSPADLALRGDIQRPLVLLSSSGTKLVHLAAAEHVAYLACFRNYHCLGDYLAEHHPKVALIGAGTRGEFREEDQMCCAWIAADLMARGYLPETQLTEGVAARWQDAPPRACLASHSVDFLLRTGQLRDLDFILGHIRDLSSIYRMVDGEAQAVETARRETLTSSADERDVRQVVPERV